jgi:transposase
MVEAAFGKQAQALLLQLDAACRAADELAEATSEVFHQHPDAAIVTSFPGLADLTGARVLAEIGDDRDRFTNARASKAYAGSAPITRASGRSLVVHHRKVKNQRLAAAGYVWAFAFLRTAWPHRPALQRIRSLRHPPQNSIVTWFTRASTGPPPWGRAAVEVHPLPCRTSRSIRSIGPRNSAPVMNTANEIGTMRSRLVTE